MNEMAIILKNFACKEVTEQHEHREEIVSAFKQFWNVNYRQLKQAACSSKRRSDSNRSVDCDRLID